jgi:hypothetical protein
VLAVLASRLDAAARELVSSWSSAGAVLLSAEDLSTPGWTFRVDDPGGGTAVVGGERVPVRELRAVLTRRPGVVAEELGWIAAADRAYVAAESNAFLLAWLDALPCRVVNRPTPLSLCGPAWGSRHWAAAASRAGVSWREPDGGDVRDVYVVGARCIGARSAREERAALELARSAGVELLGVSFSGGRACAAAARPPLEREDVRAALLDELLGTGG